MEQKFKHTLPTRDIIMRQDDDNSTKIEKNAGFFYPIVMINDIVVDYSDMISFELSIGEQLLPSILISVNDAEQKFREDSFNDDIIMTMRIANNIDNNYIPIKNEYKVTNVHSTAGGRIITFDAVLHVPLLYSNIYRVFNDTSLATLEKLAKECKLGFITNMSATNDTMNWLQTEQTIDFIKEIKEHMFVTDTDSYEIFIDQYANLCVMSIQTMFDDMTRYNFVSNPYNGEKLTQPIPFKLTNYAYQNETRSDFAKISSWSPITNYGTKSLNIQKDLTVLQKQNYNPLDTEQETVNMQSSKSDYGHDYFFDIVNDNTHKRYSIARYLNERNKDILYQGTNILCDIERYIPLLFVGQTVPLEIYNTIRPREIDNQSDVTLDTQSDTNQENNTYTLNDKYSKDCIIKSITYSFTRRKTLHPSLVCILK